MAEAKNHDTGISPCVTTSGQPLVRACPWSGNAGRVYGADRNVDCRNDRYASFRAESQHWADWRFPEADLGTLGRRWPGFQAPALQQPGL